MFFARSFICMAMLMSGALFLQAKSVVLQQAINPFEPVQSLATAEFVRQAFLAQFDTQELVGQAFKKTFRLVCKVVAQQESDVQDLQKWLRGTEIKQKISQAVFDAKKTMADVHEIAINIMRMTMGITRLKCEVQERVNMQQKFKKELDNAIRNSAFVLQQQFDILEREQNNFYAKCLTLASLLGDRSNAKFLDDADRLHDMVEAAEKSWYSRFSIWIKHFFI